MNRTVVRILGAVLVLFGGLTAYVIARNRPLPPGEYDVPILERTLTLLGTEAAWLHGGDRTCDPEAVRLNLYCALVRASVEVSGEFHHRAAALQAVRHAIDELFPGDYAHRLQDFNNAPDRTLDDIRAVLFRALDEVRGETAQGTADK